jgi:hypothetical protein
MYILELNVETWNIKKLIKMTPFFSYFVQNDPDLPTLFFTLFLHF